MNSAPSHVRSQVLKETLPNLSRVGILFDPDVATTAPRAGRQCHRHKHVHPPQQVVLGNAIIEPELVEQTPLIPPLPMINQPPESWFRPSQALSSTHIDPEPTKFWRGRGQPFQSRANRIATLVADVISWKKSACRLEFS